MPRDYINIAMNFINDEFLSCTGALLAGSVVRGEETETSDLDIVILDNQLKKSYRETFLYKEIPIEIFIHNEFTIREFFKSDAERARPSMAKMVSEGIVLKECKELVVLKKEAAELIGNGPTPWNKDQIDFARYFITDLLDDFIGSTNQLELVFIAGALAEKVH